MAVWRIREFNIFLGKWCCKVIVDIKVMWYKVLSARCGVGGEGWLEEITLRDRFMRLYDLFENRWMTMACMFALSGEEEGWKGWLEEITLRDRFTRLYDLSENRWMTMIDMFALGWGEGGDI